MLMQLSGQYCTEVQHKIRKAQLTNVFQTNTDYQKGDRFSYR